MRTKELYVEYGDEEARGELEVPESAVTIFVGPNNSGKSLALKEIEKYCYFAGNQDHRIIRRIEFDFPEKEAIVNDLKSKAVEPNQNEQIPADCIVVQRLTTLPGVKNREIVNLGQIERWLENNDTRNLARQYLSLKAVRLDAATRTTLLNEQARGDLLGTATSMLAALWQDHQSRSHLRKITEEEFSASFVIDAFKDNKLRARLAPRPPADTAEEQSLDERAAKFHKAAAPIAEFSDGVKAFTGMIATVLGQDYKVLLIDEPEAFLHPLLTQRLAKELSELAVSRRARLFAATHSADFVMGCLSGSAKVNIVRLTYSRGVSTARLLPYEQLQEIIHSPLLRSTGVLPSLFHRGAVVCEADADRAFYQEVNDKLLGQAGMVSAEAVFLNAHSMQQTSRIAGPLRKMGIPVALIVDFDIFKKGDALKGILKDLGSSTALIGSLTQHKGVVESYMETNGLGWKRKGVHAISDRDAMDSAQFLIRNLSELGVFVVPGGELESWLPSRFGHLRSKSEWIVDALNFLAKLEDGTVAIDSEIGELLGFSDRCAQWIGNDERGGM